MTRLQALWKQRLPVSAAAAVVGIVLVLVSELGGVHELRAFGALLISFGGIGLGIDAGLGSRERFSAARGLLAWRLSVAIVATILLTLPILVALVAAFVGSVTGSGNRDGLLVLTGAVIAAGLLTASLVTGFIALRAVAGALRGEPGIGTDQQPVESSR